MTEPAFDRIAELHQQLLAGDDNVGQRLAAMVHPWLVTYLTAHRPRIDASLAQDAATDAVMAYIQHPAGANASDGRMVMAHLRLAAWRNLLNGLRREGRLKRREWRYAAEHARRRRDADTRVVALLGPAGKVLQEVITTGGTPTVCAEHRANWSAAEHRVWELMGEGERRTKVYADVLGITDRPPAEQRRLVRRVKERIRARVRRGGGARWLVQIRENGRGGKTMKPGEAVQQTFMVVAVACAVVVTTLRVRDSLHKPPAGDATRGPTTPVQVPDWRQYAAVGHRMGPANAPVTIVEFADFECPVCRKFELGPLRYIRNKYPNDVQVVFRNWPLSYHRFAYPAARAAECAGAQGQFEAYHDALYQKQDSLGLKSFMSFARDAGVADTGAFATCASRTGPVIAIDIDSAAARKLGGRGTPTLLINGLRLPGAPDSASLNRLVIAAIKSATSA